MITDCSVSSKLPQSCPAFAIPCRSASLLAHAEARPKYPSLHPSKLGSGNGTFGAVITKLECNTVKTADHIKFGDYYRIC